MNCCSCNDIVGYRFHPSDKELIDHYLLNKSLDRDSHVQAIGEINGDLCDWEPQELPRFSARSSNDRTWYLFSRRKHSQRVKRKTKLGYWKLTGKHRAIKAEVGIGTKKTLVFYEGRVPKGKWTPWVIHEYTLPNPLSNQKGYFLCKLKKKDYGMADISSDQEGQPSKVEDANMPICNRNNNEGPMAMEEDPMLTALKRSSSDFKAPLRIGAQSDMPNPRQSMEVEGKGKGKAIQQSPPSSPDISPPNSPRSVMGSSSSSVVQFQCNTSATQCPIQQQIAIQTTNNSLPCGMQAIPTEGSFDEVAHFTSANLNQYEVVLGPELAIQTTNNSLPCGMQAIPTEGGFDEAAHFTSANLNQYEVVLGPELAIQTTNNSLPCGMQAIPTEGGFDEAAHFTSANLNQYEVVFSGPELAKALNSMEFMNPIELGFKFGPSSPARRPSEIPFKPAKEIKYSIENNSFLGSIMGITSADPAGQTKFEKELMEEEEEFVNQFLVETTPKEHSSGGEQKEE